jgi:iron complex outermembrane recepter protein
MNRLHLDRLTRALRSTFFPFLVLAILPTLLLAEELRRFDIPGGPAAQTLKRFADQAGVEVLIDAMLGDRTATRAVKGEMAAAQALAAMLEGTGLEAVKEPRSGALAVRRVAGTAPIRGGEPAAAGAASPGEVVELEQLEVTGSRIRGLLGEARVQPVLTLGAREIERTGATNLGEVFRYVPQISSYTEGLFIQSPFAFGASTGDATSGRVTASLRGAPAGGTLLLINGRRAPRNGQQQGQDGYDLGGIPLSAVERVEVLLDGASAVYGADAVGGVINVILKRDYRSTEVRLTYENTFDSDANVKGVSINHGFAVGRLSGMVIGAYQESGSLMWRDRDFLRTQDRRPWGGSNNPAAQIPSGNGTISVGAGNLAGVPSGTLLTIPRGSNGTNRTTADFVAAGSPPAPPGTDLAIWAAYSSPYQRRSFVSTFEYDLGRGWEAFAEARASDNRTMTTGSPLAVSSLSIPASAPGNIFGVPVTMRRYLLDLPIHVRTSRTKNVSGLVGVRGRLARDWRVEGSVGYSSSKPEFTDPLGFSISSANLTAALASADPARRPNLFYDAIAGQNPNMPGLLESLGSPNLSRERSLAWAYEIKADGPLVTLPTGEVRVAVGAEYREEYVDFPLVTDADQFSARPGNRDVTGLFAEMRVPIVSEGRELPLVHRLELSAAVRQDGYREFPDPLTPRYGVGYRPVRWLLARASYGEGFKVPTLSQLTAPTRTSNTFFNVNNLPLDPYRGNTPITVPVMPTVFGGNPALLPEETESTTGGVVLEIPWDRVKGLSFSYDYYDHKYLNRISPSLAFADRLAIFPELFTRGPNLPGDQAGWPGPIVSYDNRPVNVSTNRISGWDAGVKYLRTTPWGDLGLTGNVSRAYRNENRARPGAPPATNAVPESLPLRASGSVFWSRRGLESGVMFSYRDVFKRSLTERLTPSAIRWDWRVGYDFGESRRRGGGTLGWSRWLSDTRINLTIFNVFDEEPPMNSAGLPDGSIVDAFGRRFSVSVTKSFGAGASRGK